MWQFRTVSFATILFLNGCGSGNQSSDDQAESVSKSSGPSRSVNSASVRTYHMELDSCKAGVIPRPNPTELLDPYVLSSGHVVLDVEGFGRLRVDDEIGQGMFGKAFTFVNNDALILKGAKSDHGRDDLCWERSILQVLNGLGGGIPRIHRITYMPAEFAELFNNRVLVMDKKGDADWCGEVVEEKSGFYSRFARLLEIVQALHSHGFIHDDIKGANIRIIKGVPEEVTLIDFGQARPFVDLEGVHSEVDSRKTDWRDLVILAETVKGPKSWLPELKAEAEALGHYDEPNYTKWITRFKLLGKFL
jgi:predicted Ser/Thr protein kinase